MYRKVLSGWRSVLYSAIAYNIQLRILGLPSPPPKLAWVWGGGGPGWGVGPGWGGVCAAYFLQKLKEQKWLVCTGGLLPIRLRVAAASRLKYGMYRL